MMSFVHKKFFQSVSNVVLCTLNALNFKFINWLVDGMQLMIFGDLGIVGELGIVGSEKHPTYKKKKKRQ